MQTEDEIRKINEGLDDENIPGLEMRLKMAQAALKLVITEGDPHGKKEVYKAQVQRINAAIRRKNIENRSGGPPPPKQVIGLKVGRIGGKVQKNGKMQ